MVNWKIFQKSALRCLTREQHGSVSDDWAYAPVLSVRHVRKRRAIRDFNPLETCAAWRTTTRTPKSKCFPRFFEASTGIEPVIEVLQTFALPLGYDALLYSLFTLCSILCRRQGIHDSTGNRTRVTAVKGRCLDRLTMEPYDYYIRNHEKNQPQFQMPALRTVIIVSYPGGFGKSFFSFI